MLRGATGAQWVSCYNGRTGNRTDRRRLCVEIIAKKMLIHFNLKKNMQLGFYFFFWIYLLGMDKELLTHLKNSQIELKPQVLHFNVLIFRICSYTSNLQSAFGFLYLFIQSAFFSSLKRTFFIYLSIRSQS